MNSKATLFKYNENTIEADKMIDNPEMKSNKINFGSPKNIFTKIMTFFLNLFTLNKNNVHNYIVRNNNKNIKKSSKIIKKEINKIIKNAKKELSTKTALTVTFKGEDTLSISISGEPIKVFKTPYFNYSIEYIKNDVCKYYENKGFKVKTIEQDLFENVPSEHNGRLFRVKKGKDISFCIKF